MSKIMPMRGFLTSCPGASPLAVRSLGLTFATALVLVPAAPATAATVAAATTAAPATPVTTATVRDRAAVPGSTRSLPLVPLARERVSGAAPEQGLRRAGGARFSLLGVVWDDPDTELRGRVRVRTRSAVTGQWSGWQDVETHNAGHRADPGTAQGSSRRVRGATAPLWVGDSDGVEVRVRAAGPGGGARTGLPSGKRAGGPRASLPQGLRLELVDPGAAPAAGEGGAAGGRPPRNPRFDDPPRTALDTEAALAASAANADITAFGATAIPELDRPATEQELTRLRGPVRGKPYIGPRPRIVTRRGWGADESLRERGFVYTKKTKAAFVHHTATGNAYTCAQAPSVIRGIYRYHVKSMGWRDIGYNFLVDKCGTLYEGRAGGVAKAVLGAHTLGFNGDSMGIAVIGTYGATEPSSAAVTAVARLTAWKLGLYGVDPSGRTYLTSGGGNLYPKGKNVRLNVISGHRDGFATECPGKRLYARLGTVRSSAARYQGR
ncbi:peptidoglycan recognition protein [Streptomyces sp. NPDC047841]|uniref:peptidoglycan recognition protein family protein n=1 Tax=Streptomyces sp. NPDC047841 TaxID=3154708 RepID=UPI0034569255